MMKLKGKTFGETLGPAMEMTDESEARDYYLQLVDHYQELNPDWDRDECERVVKENLGYYAGHYNRETQVRVNRLFETMHPVFGNKQPTAEEAFRAGQDLCK